MRMKKIAVFLTCLFLCSCTTLRKNDQVVKIATEPEGAQVYEKERLLGTTPGFFDIKRSVESEIRIKKPGYKELKYKLATSYRWVDSFVSDFVWLTLAPVAWGLDLVTKTSWQYNDIPLLSLSGPPNLKAPDNRKKIISIAPPQADHEFLSDDINHRLENVVALRYKNDEVKPVNSEEGLFEGYGYDNNQKISPERLDDLYYDLKITHFLKSETKQDPNGSVEVNSKLVDIYTEKEVDSFNTTFKDVQTANWNWFKRLRYSAVDIIPNTIGIDSVTPVVNFTVLSNSSASTDEYKSVEDKVINVGSIVSAIGLRNIKDQEFMKHLRATVRIVPNISFHHDQFHFERDNQTNILQGYSFSWYTLLLGLGPEFGIESPAGYFYLQIIPCYAQNWINGSGNGQDVSSSMNSLQYAAELGYEFYISSRINLRLFARSTNPPSEPWNHILSSLTGQPLLTDVVTQTVSGISIGYFLPEGKSFTKHHIY
jgi:hypothetical protein